VTGRFLAGAGTGPSWSWSRPIGSGIRLRSRRSAGTRRGAGRGRDRSPLQGKRASTKLSDRLAHCAAQSERAATDRLLWDEFLRQSALDLAAATEALARRPEILLERLAYVAFEPGAAAGAAWASRDARVRACLVVPPAAAPDAIAARLREQLA
jgi:hypothetical protein